MGDNLLFVEEETLVSFHTVVLQNDICKIVIMLKQYIVQHYFHWI